MAYLGILWMNLLTLITLFHVPNFLPGHNESRLIGIIKYGLFVCLPGYLIINLFIKEDNIKKLKYDEATIKKGDLAPVFRTRS